jgi:hypothetical protein
MPDDDSVGNGGWDKAASGIAEFSEFNDDDSFDITDAFLFLASPVSLVRL